MFRKFLNMSILLATTVAVVPAMACTVTFGRFTADTKQEEQAWPTSDLHKALVDATQCDVNLKVYSEERDLYNAAVNKQVDLAFLKDFTYYLAQKKNPEIKPVVVSLSYKAKDLSHKIKSPYYNGYIVSLKSNANINDVKELNGKKFGFVSPNSTSGYLLPMAFFDEHKINLASTTFYYNDTRLIQELKNGKEDAIATWDYPLLVNKFDSFRVLKEFEKIPNPPIVMTHKMTPEQLSVMQKALMAIKPDEGKLLPIAGYGLPHEEMYKPLFEKFERFCKENPDGCEVKVNKQPQ